WFTGSKSDARRAIDLGCYFSINAAMMRSESGRDLITTIPADRLLTETDAPFTRVNNCPTAPSDVKATVEALATLRNQTTEDMKHTVQLTLRSLLRAAGASFEQ